jgi:adenylate cyclase
VAEPPPPSRIRPRVPVWLRITVQLIDVNDGHHLWSERYYREMTDVFEVQDEITAAIVDKLRPKLLGARSPSAARHSEDPEAYALYLKGRHHWGRRPAGTMEAIAYFEQAAKRDPTYALAYTGLADAYNTLASWEGGFRHVRVFKRGCRMQSRRFA